MYVTCETRCAHICSGRCELEEALLVLLEIEPLFVHRAAVLPPCNNGTSTLGMQSGVSHRSDENEVLPIRYRSRDSLVGIATRYELNGPGIEFQWGRDFLNPSGPTHPPI